MKVLFGLLIFSMALVGVGMVLVPFIGLIIVFPITILLSGISPEFSDYVFENRWAAAISVFVIGYVILATREFIK